MTVDRFMELFVGRQDVFAKQLADGSYLPVRRPITRQDYTDHGRGVHTYGIYTVVPPDALHLDTETKLLVFDVDTMDETPVRRITNELKREGIDFWTEFSGKKGHHVWVFLERWTPASVVRRAGAAVLQRASVQCEVFPKQTSVAWDGYGNLVKLPLGVHRGSGKRSRGVGGHWATTQRAAAGQIEALAGKFEEPPRPPAGDAEVWHGAPLVPCMERVRTRGVGEGKRDRALFGLALECKRKGMDEEATLVVCLDANTRFNPPLAEYVVRQKVRSAHSRTHGLRCEEEFLHDPEELLCSTACPRQKAGPFRPATEDGPPGSGAAAVGPKLEVGQRLELEVTGQLKRPDGRVAYTLSHPAATNTPILVV